MDAVREDMKVPGVEEEEALDKVRCRNKTRRGDP